MVFSEVMKSAELRKKFQGAVSSLNAAIDKAPDGFKGPLVDVRGHLDTILSGLPADNATDDATAQVMGNMAAFTGGLITSVNAMSDDLRKQAVSLNKLGDLEKQIESGDLVPKAKAVELANNARAEGEKSGKQAAEAQAQILSTRRNSIAKCGLPVPGDDALAGTDEEFRTREETAKKRADELKGLKVSLNGAFGPSIWMAEPTYQRDLALLKEARPNVNGAPDPFKGGSGDTTTTSKNGEKSYRGLC